MIRGLNHASISTRNTDRLLGFYRDLIGLPVVIDVAIADQPTFDEVVGLAGSRARCVFLQAGNVFVEIWEYAQPLGKPPIADRPVCDAGLTHLCFDVEDARQVHQQLVAAGVSFASEPKDLGSVVTCYARDPDGNLVELRQGKTGSLVDLSPVLLAAAAESLGGARQTLAAAANSPGKVGPRSG